MFKKLILISISQNKGKYLAKFQSTDRKTLRTSLVTEGINKFALELYNILRLEQYYRPLIEICSISPFELENELADKLEMFSPIIYSVDLPQLITMPFIGVDFRYKPYQKYVNEYLEYVHTLAQLKLDLANKIFTSQGPENKAQQVLLSQMYFEQVALKEMQALWEIVEPSSNDNYTDCLNKYLKHLNRVQGDDVKFRLSEISLITERMKRFDTELLSLDFSAGPLSTAIDIPLIVRCGILCELGEVRRFSNHYSLLQMTGLKNHTCQPELNWQNLRSLLIIGTHFMINNSLWFNHKFSSKGIETQTQKQPFCYCSRSFIRQIFKCLASNSLFVPLE